MNDTSSMSINQNVDRDPKNMSIAIFSIQNLFMYIFNECVLY